MRPTRSLRFRVIIGSLLWTLGLLAMSHMLFRLTVRHVPFVLHMGNSFVIILASLLMIGGLSGLKSGLSPLVLLRSRLTAVREGRERRVTGDYPDEVQPLVDDLNQLLDIREQAVSRALAKAADLAHGLKTPLAVLAQESERAEAAGQHESAARIAQQVERMSRQVEYNLAQSRAANSGTAPGARCDIAPCAEALARTLETLYASRAVAIQLSVAADHAYQGSRPDLDEMLGNLLDNAFKWANSLVKLETFLEGQFLVVVIDDDGPGIRDELLSTVLQRGVRADQASPGSGLGLAIVRDLAEIYGGTIRLKRSPLGGLRSVLSLREAA